jgi:hypothetical protein
MPRTSTKSPAEPYPVLLPQAVLNAFDTNNRINHYLIENLPSEAWNAKPPDGKGRTIAAIVAHMHNVRVMWLKAVKVDDIPEQLIVAALLRRKRRMPWRVVGEALHKVIGRALTSDGRVKGFRPDVVGFLGYLIAHDAHHRGQIALLACQLGHPLPQKSMFGMGVGQSLTPRGRRWGQVQSNSDLGYAEGCVALQSGFGRQQATPAGVANGSLYHQGRRRGGRSHRH